MGNHDRPVPCVLPPEGDPALRARTGMSCAELVALYVESLYLLDARGRMLALNDGLGTPPPRFALVLSAAGHRVLASALLPDALAGELAGVGAREPGGPLTSGWPAERETYRRLLADGGPGKAEYCGPAYVLPQRDDRQHRDSPARELTVGDRPLLSRHFPGWERDFAGSLPMAGVIADGAVVSLCGCARRLTRATEAGVETAAPYRSRGYAGAATAAWAEAIRRRGGLPLYSTSWDNVASRRVAAVLGAVQYAADYCLP